MIRPRLAAALLAAAAAAAIASVALPRAARADAIARGAVVQVEAAEIFVNLGRRDGVTDGARLRIKRPITVRHPVTRATVADWLPVGAAEVTSAGARLSMARLDPDLLAEVAPGDVVEIYVERDEPAPAPAPAPAPDEPAPDEPLPAVDAETAQVLAVFRALRGASLDARIAAWEGFLAAHPGSPHAAAIREDLELLRGARDVLAPPSRAAARPVGGVDHHAPTQAPAGAPVPLVFVLDDPARVESAWLHYRAAGAPVYARVPVDREGALYLRAEIPADAVAAPGVEYFLEVVGSSGEPGVAVEPTRIDVDAPGLAARFTPDRRRTRVGVVATWMDFANLDDRDGDRTDRFFQLETDVTYLLDGPVAGLSAGLGLVEGDGGFADEVWTPDRPAPHTGFQYGYAEAELAISRRVGLAGRLIAGVGQRGLGLGAETRLRVGELHGTHLSVTASRIAELGSLSQVRFQVDPFGRAPIGLSVGVTDQPAQGDLAVRLGVDVGVRALPWIEPVVRLSYQGRTVEHSGLGAGLGVQLHW